MIRTLLVVALGSAAGGVLRYLAGIATDALVARTFPWATLAVNVIGSALIGVLFVALAARGEAGEGLRSLLIIGLLGGFTTFSSFSLETLLLVEQHGYGRAGAYVIGSVALCLAAAWGGLQLARQWWA